MKCSVLGLALVGGLLGCGVAIDDTSSLDYLYSINQIKSTKYWEVISESGLNCRSGAGTEFAIVRSSMPKGTSLQSVLKEGTVSTAKDSQYRNWVEVYPEASGNQVCFVLAESRYIKRANSSSDGVRRGPFYPEREGDRTCERNYRDSEPRNYLETRDYSIWVCNGEGKTLIMTSKHRTTGFGVTVVSDLGSATRLSPLEDEFRFYNGEYSHVIRFSSAGRAPNYRINNSDGVMFNQPVKVELTN